MINMNIIYLLRKHLKKIAICMLVIWMYELAFPLVTFALTSGPTQPEVHGFEPIGTTEMVDLFSGDFTYNIPLLDVGGYPINISYHSGVTMDEEASWVGLGWSLNPGVINREVRGIPDDFKNESIDRKVNMKKNETIGIKGSIGWEIAGFDLPINLSAGMFYNNYRGFGIETGAGFSWKMANKNSGAMTAGLGVNNNSQSGISIKPSFGFSSKEKEINHGSVSITGGFNSREGLQSLSLNYSPAEKEKDNRKNTSVKTGGFNGSISFGAPTYTPSSDLPITCESYALHGTVGGDFFFNHPKFNIEGYYTNQHLTTSTINDKAYGTLYQYQGAQQESNLMDINREKDIPVNKYSVTTAVPFGTEDVFSVQGQGISGQFKPYRNDVGVFHDASRKTNSLSVDLGVELGAGILVHAGFDINAGYTRTTTGKWQSGESSSNMFGFADWTGSDLSEPFYIKNTGENLPTKNDNFYANIGQDKAVRVKLNPIGSNAITQRALLDGNGNQTSFANADRFIKRSREPRAQVFSYLTAVEAKTYGLDRDIYSYPIDTLVYTYCDSSSNHINPIDRISTLRSANHISEITINNTDGSRYVYGIPAYNTVKVEKTFATNNTPSPSTPALVKYTSSENGTGNKAGRDYYFQSQNTPGYAHSYLLTGVLSPDYVDLTNNGITDDDLGTAVKLNYSRLGSNYKWRTPVQRDSANYNDGMRGDNEDQKASFVYGEKEVWYLHSIESKNMVAQFYVSNRSDALPVKDENGGADTASSKRLKQLDKIELYSKSDLIQNGTNAIPVKTVHFTYDNSLCKGIPNSTSSNVGKLTLKKIYFTYGKSSLGTLNSYQFVYDVNKNYPYGFQNYDRWGNFKRNSFAPYNNVTNSDYPYTLEKTDSTNKWAAAWCLSEITLPSGGKITVTYESDDYGYVMNTPACDMFFIKGIDKSDSWSTNTTLYGGNSPFPSFNPRLYIELPTAVQNSTELYNRYLAGHMDHLYFNCLVNLNQYCSARERIKGYARIQNFNVTGTPQSGLYNQAWIELKPLQGGGENPIFLAALQTLRLSLPGKAFQGSEPGTNSPPLQIIMALIAWAYNIPNLIMGYKKMATSHGWCKDVSVADNKSWIRLNNPNKKKLGGGTRVNKITISDNWDNMVSNEGGSFDYGQQYFYTTTDDNQATISSGVASWEPMLGKEENPYCIPLPYEEKVALAPDNFYYVELPLGESLFPAPSVGYGKVTVKNIAHNNVKRTATGYTVNEFYTAREFPTKSDFTPIDIHRNKSDVLSSILNIKTWDYLTCSQGFSVEVNDMHGKPKSTTVYDENGGVISKTTNYYRVENENAPVKKLKNTVAVVEADGTINDKTIGLDVQMWEDMREQNTDAYSGGIHFNTETVLIPFFIPLIIGPIPFPIPSFSKTQNRFRSTATTKFIKRFGILDKVIKEESGSSVITQNLAFDAETGQTLLTKTINEFNDTLFNFTYPAHWAYEGMGPAYKNIGTKIKNVTVSNGYITAPAVLSQILIPGDEIILSNTATWNGGLKGYIVRPNPNDSLKIIWGDGTNINGNTTTYPLLTVLHSGRKNQQATPIGGLVTKNNPFVNNTLDLSVNSNVLNSQVQEFTDNWKTSCKQFPTQVCDSVATSPDYCLYEMIFNAAQGHFLWEPISADLTAHFVGYAPIGGYTCFESYFAGYPAERVWFYSLTSMQDYYSTGHYTAMLGGCALHIEDVYSLQAPYLPIDTPSSWPCQGVFRDILPINSDTMYIACFNDTFVHNDTTVTDTLFKAYVLCPEYSTVCSYLSIGDTVNPYATGLAGIWRPKKSYVYYSNRNPLTTSTSTQIYSDGTYTDFDPYWNYNVSSGKFEPPANPTKWTWNSEITLYDTKGNEVENVDPLSRYSSALFGYNHSLAKTVASNSRYRQIANDNFEDYYFSSLCGQPCSMDHFSFLDAVTYHDSACSISSDYAHSGRFSIKVETDSSVSVFRTFQFTSGDTYAPDSAQEFYILKEAGCIDLFSPDTMQNYLLSAWVKETGECPSANYQNNSIEISFNGSGQTYTFTPSGPIIEGWQRYEAKFFVPGSATGIYVTLNSIGNSDVYFDDIRIHPFNGNMKAFVYDPTTLRLMATLDENNYATFYEYDEEGNLVRLKKETERGIMTIKESRNHLKPN